VALCSVLTTDVRSSPSTGEVRYRSPTSGFRIQMSKTNQFFGRWVWGPPHVAPFHYQPSVRDVWGQSLSRWPRTGRDSDQLRDAWFAHTKQLGGYVTLLQLNNILNLNNILFSVEYINNILFLIKHTWIYEHFLRMKSRNMNPTYQEGLPRVSHYVTGHHICIIDNVHVQIDGVTQVGGDLDSIWRLQP